MVNKDTSGRTFVLVIWPDAIAHPRSPALCPTWVSQRRSRTRRTSVRFVLVAFWESSRSLSEVSKFE